MTEQKQVIPEGYKQTEVGVIPGNWIVVPFFESVSIANGQVSPLVEPYASMTLVAPDHIESNTGRLFAKQSAKEQNAISGKYYFCSGDTIYSKIRPYLRKAIYVDFNGLCSADMYPLRAKDCLEPRLVLPLILSERFSKFAESVSIRSGMPKINRAELAEFSFAFPRCLEEQTAIANALSDVDALISELEKVIAKKQAIKTATMQQLLTGKTRLPQFALREDGKPKGYKTSELGEIPEDWVVCNLSSVCASFKTGKLDANAMVIDGEYRFYTCAREYSYIDTYDFDTEALLVSGNGANVGYVHYFKGKFNAYQRTYVLSDFSASVSYLKIYLERKLADRIRVEVNAGNTPYITMDTLTDMPIVLPSIFEEQVAIGTILSDMDEEIQTLRQRLNKTRQIKQGMMQELLTGKTRLI